jgi:glycosyltransferase involved in cell wall biosynthesis
MESIPLILSDIVQMGRTLIVTDVGDMGRVVRDHHAGLVIPPCDSAALARAMREMEQEDRSRYNEGVRSLAERFDLRRTAAEWAGTIERG